MNDPLTREEALKVATIAYHQIDAAIEDLFDRSSINCEFDGTITIDEYVFNKDELII